LRLMLARPLLAGAQLRRAGDDAGLELLVEPANLLLGALPLGDVLADPDDAERAPPAAGDGARVPQDDPLLPAPGADRSLEPLHRLALEDLPDELGDLGPSLDGKEQLEIVLPQHLRPRPAVDRLGLAVEL